MVVMSTSAGPRATAPRRRFGRLLGGLLLCGLLFRGLLLVVAVVALPLAAAPASAHAGLASMSPADGSTVATSPATVSLSFDESLRPPSAIVVHGPDGARIDTGGTQIKDSTATTRIRPPGGAGRVTVDYRVLSADGHPVAGSVGFTVRPSAGSGEQPSAAGTPSTRAHGSRGTALIIVGVVGVVVVGALYLFFGRDPEARTAHARTHHLDDEDDA